MTNFVVLTLTDSRLNLKHVTMNTIVHDLPPVLFLCVIVLGHMAVHILICIIMSAAIPTYMIYSR